MGGFAGTRVSSEEFERIAGRLNSNEIYDFLVTTASPGKIDKFLFPQYSVDRMRQEFEDISKKREVFDITASPSFSSPRFSRYFGGTD